MFREALLFGQYSKKYIKNSCLYYRLHYTIIRETVLYWANKMKEKEDGLMALYDDFEVKPYISPQRDVATEDFKPVPRKNMSLLADGLLPGDIILLWRIRFGTFANDTIYSKYFEYSYGINGPAHMQQLIKNGYAYEESAFDSLNHVSASLKKNILKSKNIKGLSKMKVADLDQALKDHFSEQELGTYFTVRGYALTAKGEKAIDDHPQVIDRHPKKNF